MKIPIWLITILIVFVALATAYAWTNKDLHAPDERFHITYTDLVLRDGSLPKLQSESDVSEAHQPPLYYIMLVPFRYFNTFSQTHGAIFLGRMFSVVLSAITLLVVWRTAQLLFKNQWIQAFLVGSIAFLPMFIHISGSINNDNLANLFGALIAYMTVRLLKRPFSFNLYLGTAIVISLSLLTKVTLYPLALILFVLAIVKWFKDSKRYKGDRPRTYFTKTLIVFLLIVVVVSGWWFARNMSIYGEPFGHKYAKDLWYESQHRELFTQENLILWGRKTYESFWGIFGYMDIAMNPLVYQFFWLIGGIFFAFVLVYLFVREKDKTLSITRYIYLAMIIVILGFLFNNSRTFFQPQGRYMFVVLVPIFALVAMSLNKFLPKKVIKYLVPVYLCLMVLISLHGLNVIKTFNN